MGVFGFGNVGGAVADEGTAGFPTSGLAALYKLDEREGDQCFDATGQWPPLRVKSGVALDCTACATTNSLSVTDATGLLAAIDGLPGYVVMGAEFIAPASNAVDSYIIGKSGANSSPFVLYLVGTGVGFRIYGGTSTKIGAGALQANTFSSPSSTTAGAMRILVGTYNQVVVFCNTVDKTGIICHRSKPTGPWSVQSVAGAGTGAAGARIFGATGSTAPKLLDFNGATPFTGKIMSTFAAVVSSTFDITNAMQVFDRCNATHIRNLLGSTTARYWAFREGTGLTARELVTAVPVTIAENGTATVAWSINLTGCFQPAMRQGTPYYGRPGLRVGGEASFAPSAYAETEATNVDSFGSSNGWTFGVMVRVGNRDPAAATQILASVQQPDIADFTTYTAPATGRGVGVTLTTAQSINARACRSNSDTLYSGAIGAGAGHRENGLFTYYTITCANAATVVTLYRQNIEDGGTPTTVGTVSIASANPFTAANKLLIATAAYDADAIVGFVAMYNRVLTAAEMGQCFNAAYSRMVGDDIYVDDSYGIPGNGTENAPYSTLIEALRTAQRGQDIYIGAGEYDYYQDSSATLRPASVDGVSLYGASRATVSIIGGAAVTTNYPLLVSLADSNMTFSGITFDAAGYHSYACQLADTAGPTEFISCAFTGGKANSATVGSGMSNRASGTILADVIFYDNEEHGVYSRIFAPGADRTYSFEDIYCYGNGEDGIKFSSEDGEGASWVGTMNRIRVDGGNNQVWLAGVKNSIITNLILENQALAGTSAALYLGYSLGVDGEDISVGNTIANVTIYNAETAVLDNLSTGTTIRNLIAVGCTKDFVQGVGGTAVLTYCAGNAATDLIPTDPTNIPDSADIALTDPANATASLRDFSLVVDVDGYGDGVNLTSAVPQAATNYNGVARLAAGAWNMGAY